MKVLLIDVDSKIPNLALMKLSTFYKASGAEVGFNVRDPDRVYASIIFQKNKHKADGLEFYYPNADIDIGGTGYNIEKRIPEIELLMPDYSIYPDCDRSIGFTTRGCIRNCPFCFVPKKEGNFKIVQHPREWHNPEFKKIEILDNNILADKAWFMTVADWIMENNLKVDFNQGLDIRLLDADIARKIAELKPINVFKFAYDNIAYRAAVERGIQILRDSGLNVRNKAHFYVYCHGDEQYEDAVRRCRELKEWGTVPYVMIDPSGDITKRVKDLRRWGTRAWFTMSMDIEEYRN